MAKKTAMRSFQRTIKDLIPAAGVTEQLLTLQRTYSHLAYEIEKTYLPLEKQQLKEAFMRGAIYSTMQHMKSIEATTDLEEKFEDYYKSNFQS